MGRSTLFSQEPPVAFALAPFASIPLTQDLLASLLEEHEHCALPRLNRLWRYYRNALAEPSDAGGSLAPPAQRVGLPARLMVNRHLQPQQPFPGRDRRFTRDIVIENDIAWRIHTLIDFMFPSAPKIVSAARDESKRSEIEAVLGAAISSSAGDGAGDEASGHAGDDRGGIALWQAAALLGSVYGHVDFLVSLAQRQDLPVGNSPGQGDGVRGAREVRGALPSAHAQREDLLARVRSAIVIETVEAPRAIALLNSRDYRIIDAYILHWRQPTHEVEREAMLSRIARVFRKKPTDGHPWSSKTGACSRAYRAITQIYSADRVQRYEDDELIFEQVNRLGRVPVVHVQNLPQPLCWDGLSDVEPLIPLQDELNIRLSDRANRVTMQSFRMWLAKGIDNFNERPVGPGQMWQTENENASIESFGGDADAPSERQHIEELREALDKASGVTPAAAGHIKAKIGNLTSENALRISLMGTIAKVKRKRITYGQGIARLCELVLHALHVHGIYHTRPGDRAVDIVWGDPLPIDETRRLNDALLKVQLGVPAETVRAELGYATAQRPASSVAPQAGPPAIRKTDYP
jgi:hypothetical protein